MHRQFPVSYTHLDVYKRQADESACVGVGIGLRELHDDGAVAVKIDDIDGETHSKSMNSAAGPNPCLLYTSRCV